MRGIVHFFDNQMTGTSEKFVGGHWYKIKFGLFFLISHLESHYNRGGPALFNGFKGFLSLKLFDNRKVFEVVVFTTFAQHNFKIYQRILYF